jgi:hypothetical protein
MSPINEGLRFLQTAINHPTVRRLVVDKVKQFTKKKASTAGAAATGTKATPDQWKQYEQFNQNSSSGQQQQQQQQTPNSSSSTYSQKFKNFDWKSFQEKAFQFVIVNFMGVIFAFQIFQGVWHNYKKEKTLREKRREQEEKAQQTRGLMMEQMQQNQKLSQQLVSAQSKMSDAKGAEGKGGKSSQHLTAEQTAAIKQKQQELNEKLHETSLAAIYEPISGVGVAEVNGFDTGSGPFTADIPVQVWITDTKNNKHTFDPLVRWQGYHSEDFDRSFDGLTGKKANQEYRIAY